MSDDLQIKMYSAFRTPSVQQKESIADFLFQHLGKYGDRREDIMTCLDYALKETPSFGGLIFVGIKQSETVGVVVVNKTGMSGYIPENILVYIATHSAHRREGIGELLMRKVIEKTEGDIALHVEPDNPARRLYERLGFGNKYLEMRLHK